jgi:hypothetical protein
MQVFWLVNLEKVQAILTLICPDSEVHQHFHSTVMFCHNIPTEFPPKCNYGQTRNINLDFVIFRTFNNQSRWMFNLSKQWNSYLILSTCIIPGQCLNHVQNVRLTHENSLHFKAWKGMEINKKTLKKKQSKAITKKEKKVTNKSQNYLQSCGHLTITIAVLNARRMIILRHKVQSVWNVINAYTKHVQCIEIYSVSVGMIKKQRLKDYKEGKIKFILLKVWWSMSPVRVGRLFGPVGRNGQKGNYTSSL